MHLFCIIALLTSVSGTKDLIYSTKQEDNIPHKENTHGTNEAEVFSDRVDLPPVGVDTIKDLILGRGEEENDQLEEELHEILNSVSDQNIFDYDQPPLMCQPSKPEIPTCDEEIRKILVRQTSVVKNTNILETSPTVFEGFIKRTATSTTHQPLSVTVTRMSAVTDHPTVSTLTDFLTNTVIRTVTSTVTDTRFVPEKVIIRESEIDVMTSFTEFVTAYPLIKTETHVGLLTATSFSTLTVPYRSTMTLTEVEYEEVPQTQTATRTSLIRKTVFETAKVKVTVTESLTVKSVITVTSQCTKKGLFHKINPWS